jgi:hypothetical protein
MLLVELLVQNNAKRLKPRAGQGSNWSRILSHAGSKNNGVDLAKFGYVCPQIVLDALNVDLDCQHRLPIRRAIYWAGLQVKVQALGHGFHGLAQPLETPQFSCGAA